MKLSICIALAGRKHSANQFVLDINPLTCIKRYRSSSSLQRQPISSRRQASTFETQAYASGKSSTACLNSERLVVSLTTPREKRPTRKRTWAAKRANS